MGTIIITLIIILLFIPFTLFTKPKEIVAYYPQWKAENQQYYVKNIEVSGSADKITVLNYAFAYPWIDSSGNAGVKFINAYIDYCQQYSSAMSIDGIADDSLQPLKGQINQLRKLKERHPDLKVLISIGGWSNSEYFSDAALTDESRESFVNSCIDIFIKGNLPVESIHGGSGSAKNIFDGIDINWEFPVSGGDKITRHNENDKDNLSRLLALFRKKLDEVNTDLLLTAAIPGDASLLDNFNIEQDQNYVNWYNVMTYDYSGSWDRMSNHHMNLFSSSGNKNSNSQNSFDRTIKLLLNKYHVAKDKIIPGAAFYGKISKVKSLVNNGLNQECAVDSINAGSDKSIQYKNIKDLTACGFNYHWDVESMAPYMFSEYDSSFISFDDPQSIVLKAKYVDSYGLRGLMFWDISGDDSSGSLVESIYSRAMPVVKFGEQSVPGKKQSIKITKPKKFRSFLQGSDIIIAAETKGDIESVEFFVDNISIGSDTAPPFNWVWFNAKAGAHHIKVSASTIDGEVVASGNISIRIIKN